LPLRLKTPVGRGQLAPSLVIICLFAFNDRFDPSTYTIANDILAAMSEQPKIIIDKDETTPSMRTTAMPADTNPAGDIFGGWILSQMDLAGGSHAYFVAQGRVATVAVTGMQFHLPVYVGDEVSCYCATHSVGTTSITVLVETWVRRRRLENSVKVTEGLFTFVALDENSNPRPVNDFDPSLDRKHHE